MTAQNTRPLTSFDSLALAVRDGDVSATEQFLVELHADVENVVAARSRRMGVRGPAADVRADLAQDLLIELWQKDLHRWDPARGAFLPFARMRMRWHVASWVRAQVRFCDADGILDEMVAEGADPESLMGRARRERHKRALLRAIDTKLPRGERAVVRAVDIEDASLTDHAKKKRIHVSTACRLRQRAHARIGVELAALMAA